MKKLLFVLAISAFAACNNEASSEAQPAATETKPETSTATQGSATTPETPQGSAATTPQGSAK